ADLREPGQLRTRGNDVAQQGLGSFDIDGKIVINEKHHHLASGLTRASLQTEQLFDDTLIAAKADRIAEESSYGAKLTAIGTASTRLDRDHMKRLPAAAVTLK